MSRRKNRGNQGEQANQGNRKRYKPEEFKVKRAKLEVTKVFDGDTMKGKILIPGWFGTKSIETVVQLLAVNTPDLHVMESGKEPEDYAIEAMAMTKKLEGKTVPIEFAVTHVGNFLIRESKISSDRWNEQRLPAIVYFKKGKESLNEALLRNGYAYFDKNCDWLPAKFGQKLALAKDEAVSKHRGVYKNQQKRDNEKTKSGVSTKEVIAYCFLSFIAGAVVTILILLSLL